MGDIVVGREEEGKGGTEWSASACVLVRFQRHDVLPYAFCFNFLEATGSPFRSLLFPFFSLFVLPNASPYPPSLLAVSLVGAPRNVPRRFSALWMLLGIYPRPPLPTSLPAFLPQLSSILPRRPHRALSLAFSLSPSFLSLLPVYPFPDGFSHAAIPPPRSKGLNRPVQFPTRSASYPRSWTAATIARQSPFFAYVTADVFFISY